jgi:hypothetical protein
MDPIDHGEQTLDAYQLKKSSELGIILKKEASSKTLASRKESSLTSQRKPESNMRRSEHLIVTDNDY